MRIEKLLDDVGSRVVIPKPFDMHHHPRDGHLLRIIAPMLAKRFAGGIIMPNTVPPITTAAMVQEYYEKIVEAAGQPFRPLMTLYLTDTLDHWEVDMALSAGLTAGVKYYPRGLTTNSDSGVSDPAALWTEDTGPYQVLRTLSERGAILLLHAADGFNANGEELDPYEQEPHFIRETLPRIIDAHPELKISVEHLSTKNGATFIQENGSERLGCSLTPHHLLLDRRDLHRGGFNPHNSWIPIIQGQEHKEALRELASAGHSFVWLGSDSAPHPIGDKEAACCKGGVMTVHAGIELYAEAFETMGALDKLENFASIYGPAFYGVPPSDELITLVRERWTVLDNFSIPAEDPRMGQIRPFRRGESVGWKLVA